MKPTPKQPAPVRLCGWTAFRMKRRQPRRQSNKKMIGSNHDKLLCNEILTHDIDLQTLPLKPF